MSLRAKDVSAVIVTRGDVDLTQIYESLPFSDIVVWDNGKRHDLKVFGRYAALGEVLNPIVYVQDDDCVLSPEAFESLLAGHVSGEIVCNMPESRWNDYPDSCLVGWGAVFERALPQLAFDRYKRRWPLDAESFLRDCDVVFTTLTPHRKLDVGFRHLPWAELPSRMFKQDWHVPSRSRTLVRARQVRGR